jgi:hypothetical protein
MNEKDCEKIIDNSKEKNKINSCKNKIFIEKAIKEKSIVFCNKISESVEKEMCKDIIKKEK